MPAWWAGVRATGVHGGSPARDPPGQAPSPQLPRGCPPPGPSRSRPFGEAGTCRKAQPHLGPLRGPAEHGKFGEEARAARAGRPAGRMTKFGRAPRRRLPFMAHSPAADVAAWAPRPRGCGHGWEGAAGGGGGGSASRTSPEGRPSSGPLPSSPSPAGQARPPHSPRGKLRPGRGGVPPGSPRTAAGWLPMTPKGPASQPRARTA